MHKKFLAYVDGKSFLHKLDPRTKIITLMILSIIIFNTNRTWSLISLLLLFIAVSMVARISVKKLLLSVKPMLFFIGIVFLLHFLFAPAPVFSDVTMSVKLMDDQLNQWDDRFNPAKEYAPYTPVRLQYFENYPYLEEPENADESCYVIITRPMPSNLSTTEMQNVYFEAGHFRIEKIPFDQIPEEKLHEFSIESVPVEPDPSKRVYFGEPAVYQIKVTPEKSFSIYPSTYSFMTGLGVALKFILLILFASLMAATTKQSALIQGIERLVRPIPLKWANMTSHDLALMVFLTIRFIPLLTSTAYQIKASSKSRAFKPSKNPFRAIKIVSTSLINSIINFADDVSRAMLNRGYTGVGKTSMNELKFSRRDGVFFCSFILLMISIIMFVGWLQLSLGVGV